MLLMIVIILLMFTVIVVAHEWGHYITAKKCGVLVHEFAVGMDVRVHTIRPIDNQRDFTGKLISHENGIEIDIDGETRRFEKNEISSVVLSDDTDLF